MARKQRNNAQRCLSPETRAPAGVQWEKVQRAMHSDHVQRDSDRLMECRIRLVCSGKCLCQCHCHVNRAGSWCRLASFDRVRLVKREKALGFGGAQEVQGAFVTRPGVLAVLLAPLTL